MRRTAIIATLWGLVGCAATGGTTAGPPAAGPSAGPGCFLGSSDPTLRPPDAWEAAAEAALAEAARTLLGARVRSGAGLASCEGCSSSVTMVETRGVIGGVRVLGWWQDPGAPEPGRKRGMVWAVACLEGREREAVALLPGAFRGEGFPDRLRYPVRGCALGLSGPTLALDAAVEAAREDARRRLAMALETEVDLAFVEVHGSGHGPRGTWEFPGVQPTVAAMERVRRGARDDTAWRDDRGTGPLRSQGLVYALACLP